MFKGGFVVCAAVALGSCGSEPTDMDVYTLYRTPVAGNDMIHVATFDASEGRAYNEENCQIVAGLMGSRAGVIVAYVCRPGRNLG